MATNIWLPKRKVQAKKGDSGKILIVGGSINYTGAALLAALSAYRAGADWVTVAAPEKVAWVLNTFSPDIVTKKFNCKRFGKKHAKEIISISEDYDVLLIGNGIGRAEETLEFARKVVSAAKAKKVVDADAIKVSSLANSASALFTPHQKELKALLKNSKLKIPLIKKRSAAEQISKSVGNNVILWKGAEDYIISEGKVSVNSTGNPGMTVAGTGDVLAGATAGLLGQTDNLEEAARTAAFITGKAGDILYKKKGAGFIASEVSELISEVIKKCQ